MDKGMLERASTLAWINLNDIKNEKGKPIKVDAKSNHFFMIDLYEDDAQEIAVQKPSQIGVSTWAILKTLHSARYYGINQIHTLPTATDVSKFVPSKVNEMIKVNPKIKEGLTDKEVDSVNQKQFGKAFIYYKGTHSETESLMLTSDVNYYDELDKSDPQSIATFDSRQEGADSLRQKRYISTPTIPEFGINAKFKISDQKHWRFDCGSCGFRQHMKWPQNVSFQRRCYVCQECNEELKQEDIRRGAWEAKYKGRKISGYQLTQMIAPWISAGDLIDYWNKAEAGAEGATHEYFYNHKLGLPYSHAKSQVNRELVLRNVSTQDHVEVNSIMGVDVQEKELYAILGTEEGVYGVLRIPDTEDKSKWERWAEIMEVYDVQYCVIDGGYKPNESLEAANKFPGKVWVNWYQENKKGEKIIRWTDDDFTAKVSERYKVLSDRNRTIDWMINILTGDESIKFYILPHSKEMEMLIKHIETTYAREVTDRKGLKKREWVSTGKDDLFHALIYYFVARERKKLLQK